MEKKFVTPKASKKSLEKLLVYLGDRAGDFKKCFDIESKWCWKYADLVLKCLKRNGDRLKYGESHHIVPRCFYGKRKDDPIICKGNLVTFTFAEHIFAHFCLAMCALECFSLKMCVAFAMMYGFREKVSKLVMPSEAALIDELPKLEVQRIRSMNPNGSLIDAEGRTHYFEDPIKAKKEGGHSFYHRNKPLIRKKQKEKYDSNRDEICSQRRDDYAENKNGVRDKAIANSKNYVLNNPEKVSSSRKKYYAEHSDEIKAKVREWEKENPERAKEKQRNWRANNREHANAMSRKWKREHKEQHQASNKAWRERKIAAGYRLRLDPATGKRHWIFVGIPKEPVVIRQPTRPVNQYDKDGNFIRKYATMTDASKATGIGLSHISCVCSGKRKTAGGFIFKYCNFETKGE